MKGKCDVHSLLNYARANSDDLAAYKEADGISILGKRILVDVERGRTVRGWKPRRLGGGLGGEFIHKLDRNKSLMVVCQVDPNPLHLPRSALHHQAAVSEEALATEAVEGVDSGVGLEIAVGVVGLGDVVGLEIEVVDEVGMVVIVGMVTVAAVTAEGMVEEIVEDLGVETAATVVQMVMAVEGVDMVAVIGAGMVETEADLEVVEDSETR